jgi:hypothetical protein
MSLAVSTNDGGCGSGGGGRQTKLTEKWHHENWHNQHQ